MFVKCRLSKEKLRNTVEELILNGVNIFFIGSYGEFDIMCLNICVALKEVYSNINIFKVYSNISALIRDRTYMNYENISFDIEHLHYKQRIVKSNQIMIDKSDVVVCYVDEQIRNSGAKLSFNYAKKKNKKIINLYWQIKTIELKYHRTLTRVERNSNVNLS